MNRNFCLFMPLYDHVYGTADPSSDELFLKALGGEAVPDRAPEAVFLGHGTEVLSVWHVPFLFRGFAAHPYNAALWMYLLWPLALPIVLGLWLWGSVFVADKHSIGEMPIETWCMPALGAPRKPLARPHPSHPLPPPPRRVSLRLSSPPRHQSP